MSEEFGLAPKPRRRRRLRRWAAVFVVLALVILAFFIFRDRLPGRPPTTQPGAGDIVTAFIGDLAAGVTASGRVQAHRHANLALTAAGEVAELYVEEGDSVQAGDPLLKLDTDSLERAVASAQQELVIQEANLEALLAPPKVEDVIAAEGAVASAQAQLNDLLSGPLPQDIAASEANVRAAEANVLAATEQLQLALSGAAEAEIASAQADLIAALGDQESTQELYDDLLSCFTFELPDGSERNFCPGLGNPEEITRFNLAAADANVAAARAQLDALLAGPETSAVALAQASVDSAEAQLAAAQVNHALLMKPPSEAQIAAAESGLAQAQAALESLRAGPSESQITMAEVAVELARIGVQGAERNLSEATLRAPFEGVVTDVNVSPGEIASGILVGLADTNALEVVLEVDEIDIGGLSRGTPAAVTLETWPDVLLDGQVTTIAPLAVTSSSALVAYEVYLSIGDTDLPVRIGMTADASMQTESVEDVLLVPNAAINVDRNRGTYSVKRVTNASDGSPSTEDVQITIGLRDTAFTQVLSGLEDGDELLVGTELPVYDSANAEGPPPGVENQREGNEPFR